MSMSRKDYEAIADILRSTLELALEKDWIDQQTVGYSVGMVTLKLSNLFAQGNPRFDEDRFDKAVWGRLSIRN